MVLWVSGFLVFALLAPLVWSVATQNGDRAQQTAAPQALGGPEMLERTSILRELAGIFDADPRTAGWTHTYQTRSEEIQYCVITIALTRDEFIRFALYRRSGETGIFNHLCELRLTNGECLQQGLSKLFPKIEGSLPAAPQHSEGRT